MTIILKWNDPKFTLLNYLYSQPSVHCSKFFCRIREFSFCQNWYRYSIVICWPCWKSAYIEITSEGIDGIIMRSLWYTNSCSYGFCKNLAAVISYIWSNRYCEFIGVGRPYRWVLRHSSPIGLVVVIMNSFSQIYPYFQLRKGDLNC